TVADRAGAGDGSADSSPGRTGSGPGREGRFPAGDDCVLRAGSVVPDTHTGRTNFRATFAPMITLRSENCPICESSNWRLLGKPGRISDAFKKYGEIGEVNVVRCLDCSGKYIHPMMYFSAEFRRQLYNLDSFKSN